MSDECCEISRQFAEYRRRVSEDRQRQADDQQKIGAISARLWTVEAERDDWQMRARTLAISHPDHFTPSFVELAEWRVLGQAVLRDAVRWDDGGDYKAHWECQYCYVPSREKERPEPYPHDPVEVCGRAAVLLGGSHA